MNKFKKLAYTCVVGLSLFGIVSCTSTGVAASSNSVLDTLVEANIITLPSINLDFLNNERIEITDALLNKWSTTAPQMVEQLKSRLNFKENVKNYISEKIPTNGEDYFPISMETVNGLKTLYVISQML